MGRITTKTPLQIFRTVWLQCLDGLQQKIFGLQVDEAICLGLVQNKRSLKRAQEDVDPWQWNGMLWAVPKHRRTIQINRTRRRAKEKLYSRCNDLVACETCGNPRKIGFLCSNCLKRIREETHSIKDSMRAAWEDNDSTIQDKENVILYEGEVADPNDTNKNFVPMRKKRPSWFQKNLLS